MEKKNSLVKNASILMIATIVSRIIGLLYRRPLGEILGAVGLGYYGYASNLYAILLLVSSYSIPMAVSKTVSERLALKQYRNAHKVFYGALLYAVIVGGIAALVAFFGGGILLPSNQQNAIPALQVLAPTIFLSAILGVFRGYFQAHQNMTPTSMSQIFEQIINAIVSIVAAYMLIKTFAGGDATKSAIYGAMGGTMGTAAGVLAGLFFMLLVYLLNRKTFRRRVAKDTGHAEESYGQILRVITLMVTPIILTTFINNASMYLDSYIYSAVQGWHGIDADSISAAYGEFSNYYIPMVNIPTALASASAAAMMPVIAGLFAQGDVEDANRQINKTSRLTMFICIPSMVGLTVLAAPIMGTLFPASSELADKLLLTGSVYVVFTAVSTIMAGVLQSIGKQRVAMVNAAIALVLNLILLAAMLFALPALDIYGVMLANILFSAIYMFINMLSIRKYLGYRMEWRKAYLEPLLASLIMGLAAFGIYQGLFLLTRRPSIAVIVAIFAAIPVYMVSYVVVSHTSEEEMRRFPMGTKIVRLLRLLKVYR